MLQGLLEAPLDLPVVLVLAHVDEVDDDEAAEVAQAQMARHLLGRLEIGAQRRVLDIALPRRPARVHVDRHQRLGRVDHDVAAALEAHLGGVHGVEALLDLVAVEERNPVAVGLDPLGVAGHQHAHEALGRLVRLLALDQHLLDVLRIEVADRPLDEVGLLVDHRRRGRFQRQLAHAVPGAQQEVVVALDLRLAAVGAGGAHDQAHAGGHLEVADDLAQALAVLGVGDPAADAAAARGVGHQHAVAAGQRQVGGEGGALVAALLLDHLHQEDLVALDDLLDLVRAHQPGAAPAGAFRFVVGAQQVRLAALLGLGVGFGPGLRVAALRRSLPVVGAGFRRRRRVGLVAGPAGRLDVAAVLGLAALRRRLGQLLRGFLGEQRLAVGDRDLIVVGMDLAEGEETVAVAAIVDEGGLQGRLYPGDFGQIDVAA